MEPKPVVKLYEKGVNMLRKFQFDAVSVLVDSIFRITIVVIN